MNIGGTFQYSPMLATTGAMPSGDGAWAYEPKFDGWRVLVSIREGRVEARTRRGRLITDSVPELTQLGAPSACTVVLDGELITGRGAAADFYDLAPRLAASRSISRPLWMSAVPL